MLGADTGAEPAAAAPSLPLPLPGAAARPSGSTGLMEARVLPSLLDAGVLAVRIPLPLPAPLLLLLLLLPLTDGDCGRPPPAPAGEPGFEGAMACTGFRCWAGCWRASAAGGPLPTPTQPKGDTADACSRLYVLCVCLLCQCPVLSVFRLASVLAASGSAASVLLWVALAASLPS